MSAHDQMKAMLDQLMGTGRNGKHYNFLTFNLLVEMLFLLIGYLFEVIYRPYRFSVHNSHVTWTLFLYVVSSKTCFLTYFVVLHFPFYVPHSCSSTFFLPQAGP